jgi:branched-chain amino acid transport system permease protein
MLPERGRKKTMDAIFLQILNGLDKGGAYALIALGLTLVFGTLGVVNFAHGALFMLGAFCAVTLRTILNLSYVTISETEKDFLGNPLKVQVPYIQDWFGPDVAATLINWSVPLSVLVAVVVMAIVGIVMERGLIKHFYKRVHADQILVTFGLAIVLQEIVKHYYGANPIPQAAPEAYNGAANVGEWFGMGANIVYPWWRLIYFMFAAAVIAAVFAFLQFTTFGMVVRAGMQDRETVGLLGINIQRRFTIVFGLAAVVAGVAGAMYTPILPPDYHMGMDFLVLSFVVVVVGGMGSLGGAVLAGFLLGILQSFASMTEVKSILPGIDQIIIYLVAVIVLLTLPRGLMGRKGVMED